MLNYDDYIALFNTGDDAALIERFFADDVLFSGGSRDGATRRCGQGGGFEDVGNDRWPRDGDVRDVPWSSTWTNERRRLRYACRMLSLFIVTPERIRMRRDSGIAA